MNTKSPECWASDPNARGVRAEVSAERTLLLPFDQFAFAELAPEGKQRQQNGYFVLRFLAEDVGKHLDLILDTILTALARRGEKRKVLNKWTADFSVVSEIERVLMPGRFVRYDNPERRKSGCASQAV